MSPVTRIADTLMLRHILHHLVGLSNAAILIVGYLGAFPDLPPAHRHHAARPQDAVRAVFDPLRS